MTVHTKKISDELGNIASTAEERIELFANRLERVHQTPEFVGFDDGWKISVERYNKMIWLSTPIPSPNIWSLKRGMTLHW